MHSRPRPTATPKGNEFLILLNVCARGQRGARRNALDGLFLGWKVNRTLSSARRGQVQQNNIPICSIAIPHSRHKRNTAKGREQPFVMVDHALGEE